MRPLTRQLAWLLFSILPLDAGAVRDRCDVVELNHFYDEKGKHVWDQVIFYDWCRCTLRYQVRAWRLVKNPDQLPQRDWARQIPGGEAGWFAVWRDGEVLRDVRADSYRETWTQYDPELSEREWLPKEQRRELSSGRYWYNPPIGPTRPPAPEARP